jgi:phage baseplate assembly protein W
MSFDLKIKNGDIVIEPSGLLASVSGNQKIRQDIVKILLTNFGDNKFHIKYGSDVGALKIGEVADQKIIEMDIKRSVEEAIRYLISLQKSQSRSQYLSSSEVILDISNISTERDSGDPRLYNIFISVLTQKLDIINEVITIRIV